MLRGELEQHVMVAQNRAGRVQAKSAKYAVLTAALIAALLVIVALISKRGTTLVFAS
jgi:hypothetical protein